MKKAQSDFPLKCQGFTLIELVVVIIILGIMMTTVIPKFLSSDGFEEYAYRSEVVATLRGIQLRAMQQRGVELCHQVTIAPKVLGLNSTDTALANNCDSSELFDEGQDEFFANTSVAIANEHSVTFSTNGLANIFGFDSLGRAIDINGNLIACNGASPCQIIITGDEALIIQIESEGYIHAI